MAQNEERLKGKKKKLTGKNVRRNGKKLRDGRAISETEEWQIRGEKIELGKIAYPEIIEGKKREIP